MKCPNWLTAIPIIVASFECGELGLYAAQAGMKRWEFATGGRVIGTPAIGADGTVYIGSDDGRMYALDAGSGTMKWEFQTDGAITGAPSLSENGTLFFGSHDSYLYAVDQDTGVLRWRFKTGTQIVSAPAIRLDGSIFLGAGDGKVYALDEDSGQQRWEFQTGAWIQANPALGVDGTLFVASLDSNIYALDSRTGVEKWRFHAGGRGIYSSPAISDDGTIYFGADQYPKGQLYALDGRTGQKKWSFAVDAPIDSSPAIGGNGLVYFGADDRFVYALDAATGTVRWATKSGERIYSSPAIAADGSVYVGSYDGKVYCLDGRAGRVIWTYSTAREVSSSPSLGGDGTVYFGSWDGRVYAVYGDKGIARSSWPKFGANLANSGRWIGVPPHIEYLPSLIVLPEAREGAIVAVVTGVPEPSLQWFHQGRKMIGSTNAICTFSVVDRATEGEFWLVARNAFGDATSGPVIIVVSNVEATRTAVLRWRGIASSGLTLESTSGLADPRGWQERSNYPPANAEQHFVDFGGPDLQYYRLSSPLLAPPELRAGVLNGWWIDRTGEGRIQIDYTEGGTGWTNWVPLGDPILVTNRYLFLDEASEGHLHRVYRTTTVP